MIRISWKKYEEDPTEVKIEHEDPLTSNVVENEYMRHSEDSTEKRCKAYRIADTSYKILEKGLQKMPLVGQLWIQTNGNAGYCQA